MDLVSHEHNEPYIYKVINKTISQKKKIINKTARFHLTNLN